MSNLVVVEIRKGRARLMFLSTASLSALSLTNARHAAPAARVASRRHIPSNTRRAPTTRSSVLPATRVRSRTHLPWPCVAYALGSDVASAPHVIATSHTCARIRSSSGVVAQDPTQTPVNKTRRQTNCSYLYENKKKLTFAYVNL